MLRHCDISKVLLMLNTVLMLKKKSPLADIKTVIMVNNAGSRAHTSDNTNYSANCFEFMFLQ